MSTKILLDPPGAGLPTMELLISRLAFRGLRSTLSRRQSQAWLCYETNRVLATAREISLEQLQRQVLVPRLRGLEDSSRNWSVAMVLQHLVIVDTGIGQIISALSEDKALAHETRIADVKPTPDAGQELVAGLEQALSTYLRQVAPIKDLRTVRRHAHPWFGPLDGHGWHTLAAMHTMLHRRQLEAIVRKLKTHC